MLSKRDKDGISARETLEQEAWNRKLQGKPPPKELEEIELPYCVVYLWQWFQEIADGRNYAGMGSPLPISYTEIKAWSELTRTEPSAWEISALKAIDRIYLMETSKK